MTAAMNGFYGWKRLTGNGPLDVGERLLSGAEPARSAYPEGRTALV